MKYPIAIVLALLSLMMTACTNVEKKTGESLEDIGKGVENIRKDPDVIWKRD